MEGQKPDAHAFQNKKILIKEMRLPTSFSLCIIRKFTQRFQVSHPTGGMRQTRAKALHAPGKQGLCGELMSLLASTVEPNKAMSSCF